MNTPPESAVVPPPRHGFILLHDTLCHGVIPAEWDADDQVILYPTHADAERERIDAAEMRSDAQRDSQLEDDEEETEDDRFIEPAVLHDDGTLVLIALRRTLSAAELRSFLS
jgi:hypothetical protein